LAAPLARSFFVGVVGFVAMASARLGCRHDITRLVLLPRCWRGWFRCRSVSEVGFISLPRRWRGWFRFCGIGEVGFVAAAVTVLPRRGYLLLGVGEVVFGCCGVGMVGFGVGKACCHLWLVCHRFGWCVFVFLELL